ncbi:MAG: alpha/beta hydrolase [Caldilineaceae bacterium]
MLTEKNFVINSGSIHYAEGPPNDTPLVMLHGMTGQWQYFVSMMPSLVLRYHLFAPDLRGHGGSSWTPGAYSTPDDVGDIAALLRNRVQKPAVVFGHSYGGIVATALAASAPELVRAVITVDPPLPLLTKNGSWLDEIIYPFFQALHDIISQDTTDLDKMAQLGKLLPDLDALALRQRIPSINTLIRNG